MVTRINSFVLPLLLTAQQMLAAQEYSEAPPPPDSGLTQTLVMLGLLAAFFYLILWRPEQKRRKELERQRSALAKGDRVTAMGIVGVVSKVQEETVILRMIDGAKIEMLKGAVTEVLPSSDSKEEQQQKSD